MSYRAAFGTKGRFMASTLTSTALKVYLLDKSAAGKERGIIELCDERGKLTRTKVHFDSLGDIPDKIRELPRAGV
jgi:hypothetical protein